MPHGPESSPHGRARPQITQPGMRARIRLLWAAGIRLSATTGPARSPGQAQIGPAVDGRRGRRVVRARKASGRNRVAPHPRMAVQPEHDGWRARRPSRPSSEKSVVVWFGERPTASVCIARSDGAPSRRWSGVRRGELLRRMIQLSGGRVWGRCCPGDARRARMADAGCGPLTVGRSTRCSTWNSARRVPTCSTWNIVDA